MTARYVPDEAAQKAYLADHLAELLEPAAAEVAAVAQRLAPRNTGAMAASIHAARIDATAFGVSFDQKHFYGMYAELGTSKERARPFLRPALDAIGGRVAIDNE